MPNQQQEREHLILADRHLAEGTKRVANQKALIERMAEEGQDTALAKEFLRTLEQTLEQWHVHRSLILEALARG